jgi:FkbM family methyltransferase
LHRPLAPPRRLRHRLGQPLLQLLISGVVDKVAPRHMARWYLNASPRTQAFLYGNRIYAPTGAASRVWDLSLISGAALRINDGGDPGLRQLVLAYRLLEPDVVSAITRLLASDDRPWMVDVGANVGQTSIDALAMGRYVLAVEPNDAAQAALRHLFAGFASERSRLSGYALARQRGRARFQNAAYSDRNRLVDGEEPNLGTLGPICEVDTIDLDSLLVEQEIAFADVALLKLDIEGGEAAALSGAERLLSSAPSIVVELLDSQKRVEIAESLSRFGYQAYVLESPESGRATFRPIAMNALAESWDSNYYFLQDDVAVRLSGRKTAEAVR